jgi:hypothetical protein
VLHTLVSGGGAPAHPLVAVGAVRRAITAALGDVLPAGQGIACRQPGPPGTALPRLAEVRLCIGRDTLLPLQGCSMAPAPAGASNSRWVADWLPGWMQQAPGWPVTHKPAAHGNAQPCFTLQLRQR